MQYSIWSRCISADGLSKPGIAFSSEVPSVCFCSFFSEDVDEFQLRPDREEIYMVKNVQEL